MPVELIPVTSENRNLYLGFEEVYESSLKEYQSRIYPHGCEQGKFQSADILYWRYIFQGDRAVGSVWLEKDADDSTTALLGIFIADESLRGKGIGAQVLRLACTQGASQLGVSRVELHVRVSNLRARKCYENFGFREQYRSAKGNGIEAILMSKAVSI